MASYRHDPFFFTLLTVMTSTSVCADVVHGYGTFSVEVITLANINIYTPSSIPLSGPPVDLAVAEIRQRYSSVFQLEHTYLYDKSALTCEDVDMVADNLLAEHYYLRNGSNNTPNMTALIIPGEVNVVLKLIFLNIGEKQKHWTAISVAIWWDFLLCRLFEDHSTSGQTSPRYAKPQVTVSTDVFLCSTACQILLVYIRNPLSIFTEWNLPLIIG